MALQAARSGIPNKDNIYSYKMSNVEALCQEFLVMLLVIQAS